MVYNLFQNTDQGRDQIFVGWGVIDTQRVNYIQTTTHDGGIFVTQDLPGVHYQFVTGDNVVGQLMEFVQTNDTLFAHRRTLVWQQLGDIGHDSGDHIGSDQVSTGQ